MLSRTLKNLLELQWRWRPRRSGHHDWEGEEVEGVQMAVSDKYKLQLSQCCLLTFMLNSGLIGQF